MSALFSQHFFLGGKKKCSKQSAQKVPIKITDRMGVKIFPLQQSPTLFFYSTTAEAQVS